MDPFAPPPLEIFDPFADTEQGEVALYGGAPHCPIGPGGNYLCICA